ncbi:hypothetical protein EDD29_4069 [Actinocorallia herbida]|uniref:Uncharacterized protein n=1 Tax=Actinocorallia herbida TaxID=58109 RepID=A0A3N1CYZ7_9ACTN|nr:hypothetical protein [Actinocorallia herbida]ROO86497.1 hypothetical protein EDD29_4069 [Actinocorallia herbida]
MRSERALGRALTVIESGSGLSAGIAGIGRSMRQGRASPVRMRGPA